MSDERLYTSEEVVQMVRTELRDIGADEVLFTEAVALWFVTMLDEPPGLALTQASELKGSYLIY